VTGQDVLPEEVFVAPLIGLVFAVVVAVVVVVE
jgi:hypothetical protein